MDMDTKKVPLAVQGKGTRRGWEIVRGVFFCTFFFIVLTGGEAAIPTPTTPTIGGADPGSSGLSGGADPGDSDLSRGVDPDIEPDAILVMKEKTFHVIKGGKAREKVSDPHFTLRAGEYIWILLRNEDKIAHEFVSPLFRKVDLEFSGKGSIIYTHTAAGVRVEPEETVTIRFWLPERFYDLFYFWCNVHGKLQKDQMRGEIFLLESTE